jgi:tetratricopeptide (TPR) repeat protein
MAGPGMALWGQQAQPPGPGQGSNTASPSAGAAAIPQPPPAPLPPLAPIEVGDVQMARGNYAEALRTFQAIEPRSAEVWNKTGMAFHHLLAFDEAMRCYREAVALNPRYGGAYNNIGAVYFEKTRYAQAVRAYKRSLKYNPQSASAHANLGTAYFAERKYKQGIVEYREALQLDPAIFTQNRRAVEETGTREQRAEKAFAVAKLYASMGRPADALVALGRAFEEGFHDWKRLREDKELAALRDTPEFHQLLLEQHLLDDLDQPQPPPRPQL